MKLGKLGKHHVQRWRSAEAGFSEVTSAIFILPVIVFVLFALVEAGIYFNYRTTVNNTVEQAAAGFADDGGDRFLRTLRVNYNTNEVTTPRKPGGGAYQINDFTWSTWGTDALEQLCGAGDQNRCKDGEEPVVTCSVDGAVQPTGSIKVAPQAYSTVTCNATFPYKPVSPLSRNPVTSVGLSALFDRPIELTAVTLSKTGENL